MVLIPRSLAPPRSCRSPLSQGELKQSQGELKQSQGLILLVTCSSWQSSLSEAGIVGAMEQCRQSSGLVFRSAGFHKCTTCGAMPSNFASQAWPQCLARSLSAGLLHIGEGEEPHQSGTTRSRAGEHTTGGQIICQLRSYCTRQRTFI